ncbi:MAG: ribosomal-processing cysteine protease Prp [Clostridia bacterium]|nr:ribosomal-processing cysteine protease Prp [Clostridia bacterium]
MTKVTITKKRNYITTVECDGHTNYGEAGEDIVCAALSSVVQTALLGLLAVVGVNVQVKRNDKKGYLKFSLPENLSSEEQEKCELILQTMLCGVSDLNIGYSDFIELEVK